MQNNIFCFSSLDIWSYERRRIYYEAGVLISIKRFVTSLDAFFHKRWMKKAVVQSDFMMIFFFVGKNKKPSPQGIY